MEEAKDLIDRGLVEDLQKLLFTKPELVRAQDTGGVTLLHWTVDWPGGRPRAADTIATLCELGADPNRPLRGQNSETPLHWAASTQNDAAAISALLTAGADIDAPGSVILGGTPLLNATHFGNLQAVEALLSARPWTNSLHLAAGIGDLAKLKSWKVGALAFQAEATATNPGSSPEGVIMGEEAIDWLTGALSCAVFCEQYHCADWLLDEGADLNGMRKGADSTILHQVARRGNLSMAQYLISRGADPSKKALTRPLEPFHYAASHANPECMDYLIESLGELDPLSAAYCGRLDKVCRTADPGLDLEMLYQTVDTRTVLGRAIPALWQQRRVSVARFLLQRSPQHRQVILRMAQERQNEELIKMLTSYHFLDANV